MNAARKFDSNLPAGNTSYSPETAVYLVCYDNSKSKRILDINYRTLEECAKDTVKQFQEKGWIA